MAVIMTNFFKNNANIIKDFSVINADIASSQYLGAGEASADLAIQILGNIPNATDVDVNKLNMSQW